MAEASIDATFFSGNRQRLLDSLPGGALVVLAGYGDMQRSYDMAASFEQEASFWYLSGIERAEWQMIIDGKTGKTTLVSPELESTQVTFDGELSPDQALVRSGADGVVSRAEAERLLKATVKDRRVYTLLPDGFLKKHAHFYLNPAPERLVRRLRRYGAELNDCRRQILALRTLKQPVEVAAIEEAVAVTSAAFENTKHDIESGALGAEYAIEAQLSYDFRRQGARGHAYAPIVGGGQRACTLHYVENEQILASGELVLIDAGARGKSGYAADITRTYQVGSASRRQRQVHEAVRQAQQEIIEMIKPGLSFTEYQVRVDEVMLGAIRELGLAESRYREYFPHAISHGLGIDVHDAIVAGDTLEPGMVLTVEPGIYIPEEAIGVRIEDDVLVTETARRNLSGSLKAKL